MNIMINLRAGQRKPSFNKNDLILYDGKEFYLTTKEELFKELEAKMNTIIEKYDNKYNKLAAEHEQEKNDNAKFKEDVSKQIAEMASLIRELYKKGE